LPRGLLFAEDKLTRSDIEENKGGKPFSIQYSKLLHRGHLSNFDPTVR